MAVARWVSLFAGALGCAFVLAACGGGGDGGTTTVPTEPGPETTPGAETSPESTAAVGRKAFDANGCGGCHTLAAADANGTIGPNLDQTLPGKSREYIRESIVDPNAQIAKGFSAGVMPTNFETSLSSSELEALVSFLKQSTQ